MSSKMSNISNLLLFYFHCQQLLCVGLALFEKLITGLEGISLCRSIQSFDKAIKNFINYPYLFAKLRRKNNRQKQTNMADPICANEKFKINFATLITSGGDCMIRYTIALHNLFARSTILINKGFDLD